MALSRGTTPAYIEATKRDSIKAPKKRITKEQLRVLNYDDSPSVKPDHNLIKLPNGSSRSYMVAVSSQFRSGQEIARSIVSSMLKVDEPLPVRNVDHKNMVVEQQVSANEKAAILARKYKKEHYIMKKLSRKKFINLTKNQVDLIFDIAKQIKSSKGVK